MNGELAFAVYPASPAAEFRFGHRVDRVRVRHIGPGAPSVIEQTSRVRLRRCRIGVIHHDIRFDGDRAVVIDFDLAPRHCINLVLKVGPSKGLIRRIGRIDTKRMLGQQATVCGHKTLLPGFARNRSTIRATECIT